MTEDEMVGCHHRLNRHKFEQPLGDGEGQGSLACCSPWGHNVKQLEQEKGVQNGGGQKMKKEKSP